MTRPRYHKLSEFNRGENIVNETFFDEDYEPVIEDQYKINDLAVWYNSDFDGGGTGIGRLNVPLIQHFYPGRKFRRGFEWCSGSGFIGFDLLAHGIIDELWLGDIYRPALRSVEKTIANLPDKYRGKVHWFHMKTASDIPADCQFDLVISSPVHWNINDDYFVSKILYNDRRSADPDWKIHESFYLNIGKHLAPNGTIIMQEQAYASGTKSFEKFIDQGGLRIVDVYWEPVDQMHLYYIDLTHK